MGGTLLIVVAVGYAGRLAAQTDTVAAPRLVLQPARLLDPADGIDRQNVVVVIEGRRIVEVAPASRYRRGPTDRRIVLDGATLLPGLIDAHVHVSIGGPPRSNAALALKAGFTTVADLGAVSQRVQVVRDSIAAGVWEGPRMLAAGLWIGVKGGVCEFNGIGVAGGAEVFRERVRDNLTAGADLIKACVTGWPAVAWARPDSAELPLDVLTAMVAEAHQAQRIVVAHALSREGVRRALTAGVDGLVHTAYVDDSLATRMREREMWIIPTLASLTRGDSSPPALELRNAVSRLYRHGVMLVYGTDGGVLPHGRNAEEALALQGAGVAAIDILRAATANAARALGLADSVGGIRPGMVADLIAIPGDPLSDLSLLQRPKVVIAGGRIVIGATQ